jgi:outer membrane receptor protein involved in Fe transport
MNYMWSENIQTYLQGRFVGEKPPLNDYAGLQKQPGFGVYDAGLKYQSADWLFSVDVNNIWDTRYPEEVAVNWSGALDVYPAPGRIWTGSCSWSF